MCITNLYVDQQHKIVSKNFSARFVQKWRRQTPDTLLRKKLYSYNQKLFLVDKENGLLPVLFFGEEHEKDLIFKPEKPSIVDVQPGFISEPLILMSDGKTFRWSSINNLEIAFESPFLPESATVYGLSNNKILIREKNSVSVYTQNPFCLQWSTHIRISQFFIIGETLILFEQVDSMMRAINLQTYRQLWCTDSITDQITSFIGFINGLIWVNALGGKVIGFDIENGLRKGSILVKNQFNPSGVLDRSGKYYVCNGLNFELLDLNSLRSIIYSNLFAINPSVSTAVGNCSILLENEKILFFDDQGKLFIASCFRNILEGPLWQAEDMIMSYGIQDDLLFVLERNNNLTALS